MKFNDIKRCELISMPGCGRRVKKFNESLRKSGLPWTFRTVPGFDGGSVPRPSWWDSDTGKRVRGQGAWGAYLSHFGVLTRALSDGADSVVVCEDDAYFIPDAARAIEQALLALENTPWDILYLGGQHINLTKGVPAYFASGVVKTFDCNRTHAYIVRRSGMEKILRQLLTINLSGSGEHLDHWIGRIQQSGLLAAYALHPFVSGQQAGYSTIMNREYPARDWNTGASITHRVIGEHTTIDYMYCGFGSPGFDGKLGYDDLDCPDPNVLSVGCHAPANIHITANREIGMSVCAAPSYGTLPTRVEVDGNPVQTVSSAGQILNITLPPGSHSIDLRCPGGNYKAHTYLVFDDVPRPAPQDTRTRRKKEKKQPVETLEP